jgi:hypothetical protein
MGKELKGWRLWLWWWSPRMVWMRFKYGTGEKILRWLAWRVPRKLVYWCGIRMFAHGTQGRWSESEAPSLTISNALCRWEHPN